MACARVPNISVQRRSGTEKYDLTIVVSIYEMTFVAHLSLLWNKGTLLPLENDDIP
ncbi:hypothetical protein H5410_058943 [Solanum commersonii]|uniref:Uncharacterized protein n=1 Tax=Solanum commersonii TaxID=4109 RepID=A0A9J5W181_SOLCO|nr:hypothetical protein H5410_058943 [Solanum commersonii]